MTAPLFSAHAEPGRSIEGMDLRTQQDIWDGEGAHCTIAALRAQIRSELRTLPLALLLVAAAVFGFAMVTK